MKLNRKGFDLRGSTLGTPPSPKPRPVGTPENIVTNHATSSKSQSAPHGTTHAAQSHAACDESRTVFPEPALQAAIPVALQPSVRADRASVSSPRLRSATSLRSALSRAENS